MRLQHSMFDRQNQIQHVTRRIRQPPLPLPATCFSRDQCGWCILKFASASLAPSGPLFNLRNDIQRSLSDQHEYRCTRRPIRVVLTRRDAHKVLSKTHNVYSTVSFMFLYMRLRPRRLYTKLLMEVTSSKHSHRQTCFPH